MSLFNHPIVPFFKEKLHKVHPITNRPLVFAALQSAGLALFSCYFVGFQDLQSKKQSEYREIAYWGGMSRPNMQFHGFSLFLLERKHGGQEKKLIWININRLWLLQDFQHKENINFHKYKLTKSCLALIIERIMETIHGLSLIVVIIIVLLGVILEGLITVGKAQAR